MDIQKFKLVLMMAAILTFTFLPTGSVMASPNPSSGAASSAGRLSSDLIRIQFARGATSGVVSGDLAAYSSVQYVLGAMAGQLMEVTLSAPAGVTLAVTSARGRALTSIASSSISFRGVLPRTGDYILKVTSGSQRISFSLNVTIPQRISFERGSTSATLNGNVGADQSHDYVLRAQAGQLMEINVTPEKADTLFKLIIYGADGTVLRSGMGEGMSYRGELPSSQDYIVTVRADQKDAAYTIQTIIPQRIAFQIGAISGAVTSTLKAYRSQFYVLRAMKNQTMQVAIDSDDGVQLIVYGADGTVLKSGMGEGSSFEGVLPSTQDYILVVKSGAEAVKYTLLVTIPPLR